MEDAMSDLFSQEVYEQAARAAYGTPDPEGMDHRRTPWDESTDPYLKDLYRAEARAALGTVEPIVEALRDALAASVAALEPFAKARASSHWPTYHNTIADFVAAEDAVTEARAALAAVSTENPDA